MDNTVPILDFFYKNNFNKVQPDISMFAKESFSQAHKIAISSTHQEGDQVKNEGETTSKFENVHKKSHEWRWTIDEHPEPLLVVIELAMVEHD